MEPNFTLVSGYWNVENKFTSSHYLAWFENTMLVPLPMIFFGDEKSLALVKSIRSKLNQETIYILLNLDEFCTRPYSSKWKIHPRHCPSIQLHLIWHEKIFLLQRAKNASLKRGNIDWFLWYDAGMCTYRDNPPPPVMTFDTNLNLPQEKMIYTSSQPQGEELIVNRVGKTYYHYVSGTYMIHSNLIDKLANLYLYELDAISVPDWIWTDQVIWTCLLVKHPDLFFKIAHGYGVIMDAVFI